MRDSVEEKYLGDKLTSEGNINKTIADRKAKSNGIIAEILSIVSEIPLGKHRVEVGLKLREAMFINGILYNSEAWHGMTKKHTKILEQADEGLLRGLINAHCKAPKEFLYLETGALPLKWVIAQRRINYLKNILDRSDDEILKKVFFAQKANPTMGDFVELVGKDLESLGITESFVETSSKTGLKKHIKKISKSVALILLKERQLKHTKIKNIEYKTLEIQPYLKSDMSRREMTMLTALRSQCLKTVRANFKKIYRNVECPLNCDSDDTQKHLLKCPKIATEKQLVDINMMYGSVEHQKKIAVLFMKIMRIRKRLIDEQEEDEEEQE